MALDEALQALPSDADRARVRGVARQAAYALAAAADLGAPAVLFAIEKALARLYTRSSDDPIQQGARSAVVGAIHALFGDEHARGVVARTFAFLQGAKEPESNALKVRAIAREVRDCLVVLRHRNDPAVELVARGMPRHLESR